jgi:serine/threonine protein kinase
MPQAQTACELRPTGEDLTGRTLGRRYQVERRLGQGAAGIVYSARSLAPALATHGVHRVALKVLTPESARQADVAARFVHEAYLGTQLAHPGILPVLDFGQTREKRPYHVTPLLRGATLARLLSQAGVLPAALISSLIEDAASALEYLHDHGIVHRDVKPSNLFVVMKPGQWPSLRLLDLGVCAVFDPARAAKFDIEDAGPGGRYGSPLTFAPEQALGLALDGRVDVYALACVAFRMLAGRDAFRETSIERLVHAHLFADPPVLSSVANGVPPQADAVLARGLSKRAADRYPTVSDFAQALGDALA